MVLLTGSISCPYFSLLYPSVSFPNKNGSMSRLIAPLFLDQIYEMEQEHLKS